MKERVIMWTSAIMAPNENNNNENHHYLEPPTLQLLTFQ